MGHRGHNTQGRLLCPFRGGAGSPSNTMWPGLRSTSVPSGVFIHSAMGQTLGGRAVPFFWGELGHHRTQSPGPRPTSVPSGILIHLAIWPQQMGRKWGCAPLGEGQLGPHLTQCGQGRGLPACQVSSSFIQSFGHSTPTSQTDRQTTVP